MKLGHTVDEDSAIRVCEKVLTTWSGDLDSDVRVSTPRVNKNDYFLTYVVVCTENKGSSSVEESDTISILVRSSHTALSNTPSALEALNSHITRTL